MDSAEKVYVKLLKKAGLLKEDGFSNFNLKTFDEFVNE